MILMSKTSLIDSAYELGFQCGLLCISLLAPWLAALPCLPTLRPAFRPGLFSFEFSCDFLGFVLSCSGSLISHVVCMHRSDSAVGTLKQHNVTVLHFGLMKNELRWRTLSRSLLFFDFGVWELNLTPSTLSLALLRWREKKEMAFLGTLALQSLA